MKHIIQKISLYFFLIAVCSACTTKDLSILPPDVQLRAGDIVFRLGNSIDSQAILAADHNGSYSHIGIVVDSADQLMIVHAVPDEPEFPGDRDRIKMDRPEIFFLKSRATIGEVMRIAPRKLAPIAAKTALRLYYKQLPFDHEYDDQDSSKMYCTELVIYSYRTAGIDLTGLPPENITFPIHFEGYFPSAIHSSPYLKSIRKF